MFNEYISASDFSRYARLIPQKTFLNQVDEVFHTTVSKPTYRSVHITNGALVTVPIFDTKAMILLILHDMYLMLDDNIAVGPDIFTGIVDDHCDENKCYREIHTGNAWKSVQ